MGKKEIQMSVKPQLRRRGRAAVALTALAAAGTMLAACSSGSSSTSASGGSSASGGASASGAASAPAGGTATAAAAGCSSLGAATSGAWKAPTTPVKPPAKKGLAVIIPNYEAAEAANRPADGMIAALKALGWKTVEIDGKGTPSVENAAIRQGISLHADAILTIGVAPALASNSIAAARAAGIPIFSNAQTGVTDIAPQAPSSGYLVDVSPDEAAMGKLMGQYINCSTGGKADVLPFNDNEFASSALFVTSTIAELQSSCPGCKIEPTIQFQAVQSATIVPGQTVSYVRTHPSVDSVLTPYDPTVPLQGPAMKAAQLADKVKFYSEYGDLQNLDYIRTGTYQAATVGAAYELSGWATVDEMLRYLAKQPFVPEDCPFGLITKDLNMPDSGKVYTGNVDYASAYSKLWGLSS
jgi:ribose transport system substrate-binding protein